MTTSSHGVAYVAADAHLSANRRYRRHEKRVHDHLQATALRADRDRRSRKHARAELAAALMEALS